MGLTFVGVGCSRLSWERRDGRVTLENTTGYGAIVLARLWTITSSDGRGDACGCRWGVCNGAGESARVGTGAHHGKPRVGTGPVFDLLRAGFTTAVRAGQGGVVSQSYPWTHLPYAGN